MDILIFWIIFSAVAGVFAGSKGRSPFGWFFLSCILSPVITIVLIAIMPSVPKFHQGLEANLNEAQRLLDKGIITNDEYQAKRKAIIENN